MRINWVISSGYVITMYDINAACSEFYIKYKIPPDTVRLDYISLNTIIQTLNSRSDQLHVLEKGKQYGYFIALPGGMVELLLMNQEEESISAPQGGTMFYVENTLANREFEKHILGSDS